MGNTAVKALIIASISSTIGLLISQNAPTIQSAITVPMTAWILFQFRSKGNAWKAFGMFKNPAIFGINSFFLSFTYLSWKTVSFDKTIYMSTGVFMLGGAISLMLYKYWNIGS